MANPEPQPTADRPATPLISVVIPCFDEAEVLPLLFERLNSAMRKWGTRCEVIAVDDGSRDDTWAILCQFHDANPGWKAIRLARSFGHQVAIWAGLRHVSGDAVLVLDADLQDPPEQVPNLLDQWRAGYDIVYAIRQKRKEGPFMRAAYFCYYRLLAFLSEIDVPLDSGDFCLMDRRVVNAMTAVTEQEPFIRGLRAWVGFRQVGVPYERDRRAAGKAKYTFAKLTRLGLNGAFSYSTRPLRLATYLGFLVSILAFLGAIFTLLQRVFADQFAAWGMPYVPGFATIVIALLFLGGVQLVCVGILGEYVGRIYDNVRGRPQFTVGETRGMDQK